MKQVLEEMHKAIEESGLPPLPSPDELPLPGELPPLPAPGIASIASTWRTASITSTWRIAPLPAPGDYRLQEIAYTWPG